MKKHISKYQNEIEQLDDTWLSSSDMRAKYHLAPHELQNYNKKGYIEIKHFGNKTKYYKMLYWPYTDDNLSYNELIYKIKSDYKNGIFSNISTSLKTYLSKCSNIKILCENKLKEEPSYSTIGKVLLAIADKDKDLKKCIICGKPIPFRDNGSASKHATFCSRECAMTEEGKRIQVERFKEKNPINPACREEIKEKIRQTNLKRYGVENPGANKEVQNKREKTTLEHYGTKNYFSSESFFKTVGIKHIKNNFNNMMHFFESVDIKPLFNFDDYIDWRKKNESYNFQCKKCGAKFSRHLIRSRDIKCPVCSCDGLAASQDEYRLYKFIKNELKIDDLLHSNRSIIYPYELDMVSEKYKLAFEFDGLYWHSETIKEDRQYHLMKTQMAAKKGIQLIHIFEDEWVFKNHIVKSRIKALFGLTPYKIQARKCEAREIRKNIANKFIEKYHIQGCVNASVYLGLFYHNHLVAVMTFGKSRFNKKYDWELLRYCTVANFNVVGGAGKLLSYFRRNYTGSIITYADKRWSTGNMYKQLGFTELKDSAPNYYYVKNCGRYSRLLFQKHKLKGILPNFNPEKTEYENMVDNGYHRIWDCGNKVFILDK